VSMLCFGDDFGIDFRIDFDRSKFGSGSDWLHVLV
jgi:hypothetical protein